MDRPRITLYSFSFGHHGRYSSVHRLLHYAARCRTVDMTFPLRGRLGPVWEQRLEYRWQRLSEWRLRPVFARRQRQCVHYIHPENSLFHGGDWKGRHGLVLTCHQPGPTLRRMSGGAGYRGFFRGLAAADRVVLLAGRFLADYREFCRPERLVVIPHGADVDFFQPAPAAPKRPCVVTIGNWLRDYDLWAETVLQLEAVMPEVEFTVVALPAAVESARHRLGERLAGRVRFLQGLTDEELREVYQRATLVFLPLKDAGANNAVIESLASGVPMLVSDLPATREYAAECAVYFEPGKAEECAAKLLALLRDDQRRAELGLAGRRRAVEQFAWEVIAERYGKLYREVLSGG
jgi:glycosyltransferase involved in cell wall biosynthesis